MANGPVDFSKFDPTVQEYITDMRETVRKSKEELKAIGLERDALIARLEEIQKEKISEQNQAPLDARTLSPEDYRKFKREMRHKAVLAGYDERQAPRTTDVKDTRKMSREEYREWKLKVSGRKAW